MTLYTGDIIYIANVAILSCVTKLGEDTYINSATVTVLSMLNGFKVKHILT
jgi:hypothetical protein